MLKIFLVKNKLFFKWNRLEWHRVQECWNYPLTLCKIYHIFSVVSSSLPVYFLMLGFLFFWSGEGALLCSLPHLLWLPSLSLLQLFSSILLIEYFQSFIFLSSGNFHHRALKWLVEFHIILLHKSYRIMDFPSWKRFPSHLSKYIACLCGQINNSCQVYGEFSWMFYWCLNMQDNP